MSGAGLDPAMAAAVDWFARLQAPDADAETHAAFDAWRHADPSHEAAYRTVRALWDSEAFDGAVRRHAGAAAGAPPHRGRRSRRLAKLAAAATVVLLAVGLAGGGDILTAIEADYRTATGERTRVTLADGSVLRLNSASAVAVELDPDRRRVRLLAGEGYFEVTPDPARPFEVLAEGATAHVVGTAFAMRRAEAGELVTVRHGQVAVTGAAEPARSARLDPGDQVVVAAGQLGQIQRIDTQAALAWLDGRFIFHRQPLGQVLEELRCHHTGWIIVADDRLRRLEVSGNYRLDDPVAVAAALADAASADLIRLSDYLLILR